MSNHSFLSIAETSRGKYPAFLRDMFAHLEYIVETIKSKPGMVLEFGCGTGFHSCVTSRFADYLICLDFNPKILQVAKVNMKKFGINSRVDFILADVFHLPFRSLSFDTSFSQGLLEHFSNDDIRRILRQVMACSKKNIILSLPSNNYPKRDLGDERLLPLREWAAMLRDFKPRLRYYRFDLHCIKNSILAIKFPRPWHILIKIKLDNN